MSNVDFSQFPFTHTRVFSRIVESLDSTSLLTCRRVCVTWLRWIKKSKVWTQLAPIRISVARRNPENDTLLNYRLDRIQLNSSQTEAECRALAIRVDRMFGETEPAVFISEDNRLVVKRLMEIWKLGAIENPVLGPVSAYVRVRVEHKVIKQIVHETLGKYLRSIMVDKKDNQNKLVMEVKKQNFMLQMNWTQADFSGKIEPISPSVERGMRGEMTLEEALKESMKSEDEDKKREREEEEDAKEAIEPKSKRSKLDDECDLTESSEDPNEEIEPILKSHPRFPTLLELLDFDTPIIKEALIQRCQIDKQLIVPQVFECLNMPDLFETSFTVKGMDSNGECQAIPMDQFKEKDGACMNYAEPTHCVNRFNTEQVLFWGGRDLRHHWPEFSQQLDTMDAKEREDLIKKERLAKDLKKNEEVLVKTVKNVYRKTGAAGWAQQGLNSISIEVSAAEVLTSPGLPPAENLTSPEGNQDKSVAKPENGEGTCREYESRDSIDGDATDSLNSSKRIRKLGNASGYNQAGTSSEGACSSKCGISNESENGACSSKSGPSNKSENGACSSKSGPSNESGDGDKKENITGAIKTIGSDTFAHLLARGINLSVATKK